MGRQVAGPRKCENCGVVKDFSEYYATNTYTDAFCIPCRKLYAKARFLEVRKRVLAHYGGKCVCCGESRHEFLSFDHIEGRGKEHRGYTGGGSAFVRWLIKNNYPKEFQILCHNCNLSLGFYGYCPHRPEIRREIRRDQSIKLHKGERNEGIQQDEGVLQRASS
jgi:hypothetical protein